MFASLCDKLVDIDAKLNIVPQLAESYRWIDSKTLEFKLRPNVKFHDGTALDSEAVKFNMDRHLNLAGSTRKGEIGGLDHVEVIDPLTVRMVLKSRALELAQRERIAAIERGVDVSKLPPLPGGIDDSDSAIFLTPRQNATRQARGLLAVRQTATADDQQFAECGADLPALVIGAAE